MLRPRTTWRAVRTVFVLLGALLIGASGNAPQQPVTPAAEQPTLGFSWAMTTSDLGGVVVPAAGASGWDVGPYSLRYRRVSGFTSDPTFEIVAAAPDSGHPTLPERFLLQYPRDWLSKPFDERALVVAFHSYSVSEKQIFLDTDLPYECHQRGWMLLAPYGLRDTNFANVASQESLEQILAMLYTLLPFNYERIYGVGFSMGGLNAMSFAMRHLDPGAARFAGVICHTGTVDMVREYEQADAFLQMRLRNPTHFGVAADVDPFAYERVSPARILDSGLVDADRAPISGAVHIPFYIHANLADPNPQLLDHALALKNFLSFHGATVYESLVHDAVAGHSWSTLPLTHALDTIGAFSLPGNPPTFDGFCDREGTWLYSEVRQKTPGVHARYKIEIAPIQLGTLNSFAITETQNLDEVVLRLRAMGLDPTSMLRIECSSVDATGDVYVLKGYPHPPSGVRVIRGGASSWSHDPATKELRVQLALSQGTAHVEIQP